MKTKNNERIEWSRVWREEANRDVSRVLLIGDSIVDGSKSFIGEELAPDYAISAYITSKGVDNPYFLRELELLCEQEEYGYRAVYFNNGLHPHGQSPETYKENYKKIIAGLRKILPNTPILLGLSTPWTQGDAKAAEGYDAPVTVDEGVRFDERNALVIAYNDKVLEIASEEGLPCFDAYTLMLANTQHKTPDGVHFYAPGYRVLSHEIALAIKPLTQD